MVKRESTERELQKAKEDLEDLEGYIREFAIFLPLAVCSVNPLGRIIDVNTAFEELTGFKSTEIVGEFLETIFFSKKQIKKIEKEILKKEIIQERELTIISKEKRKIPVNISISARKDTKGNFIGYFLGIADITAFKRLQAELEERVKKRTEQLEKRTKELEESKVALMNMLEDVEEARKRAGAEKNKTLAIISHLADGLLVFDEANRISLINPEAEKLLRVKTENIIGKILTELTQPQLNPLINLLKEEGEIFRKEVVLGEKITVEVSRLQMGGKDEGFGTTIVLHDITREKAIERMKTEFVSLAAHQLRTPLSAIKWTLTMLLEGDVGEISQEQRDLLDKTYKSNERMINLINDLLDVTRIEEGRYIYQPVFTELETVVDFVLKSQKELLKRKKLSLEFKKPKTKLPKVAIDVERIRLVVQNLLDNAIHYTPEGGKITVGLKETEKEVEFRIQDTGIGIPQDQQKRIFTKFFRSVTAIRLETEGSGLGLFLAKNIIEAHGGKIWFESQEGKGSTFYFSLPVKKQFEEFLKEF